LILYDGAWAEGEPQHEHSCDEMSAAFEVFQRLLLQPVPHHDPGFPIVFQVLPRLYQLDSHQWPKFPTSIFPTDETL
jgi:hypothetical protein